MARRSPSLAADSLELLLDTICNTFGGILFVALLVCLMTQGMSQAVAPAEQADTVAFRKQLWASKEAQLRTCQERTEELKTQQAKEVAAIRALASSDSVTTDWGKFHVDLASGRAHWLSLRDQVSQAQHELRRLKAEGADVRGAIDAITAERQRTQTLLTMVREKLETAKRESGAADQALDDARKKAEESRRKQTINMRLPMAHATTKRQIPVLIADSRVRFLHRFRDGIPVELNRNELQVEADVVRAPPGKGLLLKDGEATAGALQMAFRDFTPGTHYICVAVWPDSHAQFQVLRRYLAEAGFEYQIVLVGDDKCVRLGESDGEVQ